MICSLAGHELYSCQLILCRQVVGLGWELPPGWGCGLVGQAPLPQSQHSVEGLG